MLKVALGGFALVVMAVLALAAFIWCSKPVAAIRGVNA